MNASSIHAHGIPASLGLRVRHAGDLIINAASMIDGGFHLAREPVADLHRQLGEWLAANQVQPTSEDLNP